MKKKVTNQKEEVRKVLRNNIHPYLPPSLETKQLKENPHFLNVAWSPICLKVVDLPYTFLMDEYLAEANIVEGYPWRLIDTVDDKGWVTLKINLNQTQDRINDHFKRILRLLFEECKKHHRITKRVSNREFDLYLEAYKLRKVEKWTFSKIAKKMFPGDFKDYTGEGDKAESATKKAKRFYNEAKKIIEGE